MPTSPDRGSREVEQPVLRATGHLKVPREFAVGCRLAPARLQDLWRARGRRSPQRTGPQAPWRCARRAQVLQRHVQPRRATWHTRRARSHAEKDAAARPGGSRSMVFSHLGGVRRSAAPSAAAQAVDQERVIPDAYAAALRRSPARPCCGHAARPVAGEHEVGCLALRHLGCRHGGHARRLTSSAVSSTRRSAPANWPFQDASVHQHRVDAQP